MLFDAIVLAGTSSRGDLKEYCQVSNEALIPIGDKLMVEHVVDALKKVPSVNRIAIAGPLKELAPIYKGDPKVMLAEQGDTQVATLLNGLELLKPGSDQRIIVAAADIPLLTHEAIEDLLEQCNHKEGDLFYPIVPKEVNEERFPGVKRTYIHFKEGIFTGGNLFVLKAGIIKPCATKADELINLRKSPLALSKQIGWGFILKFLLRILSIGETEKRFSDLLGIKGFAIISPYPEIGVDVDKLSDLELAREILAN